jgi:hypothetical protein
MSDNETTTESDNQLPTITDAGAPFDNPDADVILRSADNVDFRIFKLLLSLASPFFKDMFALPQTSVGDNSNETKEGLPVIQVAEESKALERLLIHCYPVDVPVVESLKDLQSLLEVAMKYNVERAEKNATRWLFSQKFLEQDPVWLFTIACHYRMKEKASIAAKATLGRPILERPYGPELEYLSGGQLYYLLRYHKRCKETAITIASEFTWMTLPNPLVQYCESCRGKYAHVGDDGRARAVPGWWVDYMQNIVAVLEHEAWSKAQKEELMEKAVKQGWKCARCGPKVVGDLRDFMDNFSAKIDLEISKVCAFLLVVSSVVS